MIFSFFSWIWIFICALLWGSIALFVIGYNENYEFKDIDIVLITGLCFLTVYAQTFSIFGKVGILANFILLITDIIILFTCRDIVYAVLKGLRVLFIKKYNIIVLLLVTIFMLAISSGMMFHYDTSLYHAQSIRWIEEYGVVKGLGNLHNRFAYNSSFFCLQALFSMKFLFGQSLHSLNGFICVVFTCYAIGSFKIFKYKRIYVSDFLRVTLLIFFGSFSNITNLSSPGSDIFTLSLIIYILIKWIDLLEEKESHISPFAVLCLLGAFAVTLKLSAAMIVLLTFSPLVHLIQQKKWKPLILYVLLGIIIVSPYLIRNIIISGYLIYPYPELDVFSFDWKMPAFNLIFDRNEIKAWGRCLNDFSKVNLGYSDWFPVWINSFSPLMKLVIFLDTLILPVILLKDFFQGLRNRNLEDFLFSFTIFACIVFWFFGAPLPRYGSVYLIILFFYFCGCLCKNINLSKRYHVFFKLIFGCIIVLFFIPVILFSLWQPWNIIRCSDYDYVQCHTKDFGSETIYAADVGDQTGYYAFPSIAYEPRLDIIELRGSSLEDGFRMKPQYRDAYVSNYGNVFEEDIFINNR